MKDNLIWLFICSVLGIILTTLFGCVSIIGREDEIILAVMCLIIFFTITTILISMLIFEFKIWRKKKNVKRINAHKIK